MAKIEVDSAALNSASGGLGDISGDIQKLKNALSGEMDNLRDSWKGQASDSFTKEFETVLTNFQAACDKVAGFSSHLGGVAKEANQIESDLAQGLKK